ncbi:hypothetical protein AVEN_12366-1 [Araneus ventricosus]|uniref:Uncharacterized protein n=1 Tax=Araneus ventricosus TaxID=182803 RepID=A0A4Y2JCX2_ARAVE|nr:hypothetical protein AVEN_12366-1 [Araneus ventricosus]
MSNFTNLALSVFELSCSSIKWAVILLVDGFRTKFPILKTESQALSIQLMTFLSYRAHIHTNVATDTLPVVGFRPKFAIVKSTNQTLSIQLVSFLSYRVRIHIDVGTIADTLPVDRFRPKFDRNLKS